MTYAFYPGCALESSNVAYDQSVREVMRVLGLELRDVDDWNCCGATEFYTLDKLAAYALTARNLARVDSDIDELVAPCSNCYLNLKRTDRLMGEDPLLGRQIDQALAAGDLAYEPGRLRVRHALEVFYSDVGRQVIADHVVRPLSGLRVAPYYGCQIVRPLNGFDNPEYPVKLDELLGWLGAEVVDYPVKSHCCGGHMTQISDEQALELIRRLLQGAEEYDADVVACVCPMCQLNLDAYQDRVNSSFDTGYRLPVLFFTQLMGLAFGLDAESLGVGKELVAAGPVLEAKVDLSASPRGD